jgi:hypothetical protein
VIKIQGTSVSVETGMGTVLRNISSYTPCLTKPTWESFAGPESHQLKELADISITAKEKIIVKNPELSLDDWAEWHNDDLLIAEEKGKILFTQNPNIIRYDELDFSTTDNSDSSDDDDNMGPGPYGLPLSDPPVIRPNPIRKVHAYPQRTRGPSLKYAESQRSNQLGKAKQNRPYKPKFIDSSESAPETGGVRGPSDKRTRAARELSATTRSKGTVRKKATNPDHLKNLVSPPRLTSTPHDHGRGHTLPQLSMSGINPNLYDTNPSVLPENNEFSNLIREINQNSYIQPNVSSQVQHSTIPSGNVTSQNTTHRSLSIPLMPLQNSNRADANMPQIPLLDMVSPEIQTPNTPQPRRISSRINKGIPPVRLTYSHYMSAPISSCDNHIVSYSDCHRCQTIARDTYRCNSQT